MKLSHGRIGATYRMEKISLPQRIQRRLEALGMTRKTTIQIINEKDRGTMIVRVRGTRFAIGRDISENIQVTEVSEA